MTLAERIDKEHSNGNIYLVRNEWRCTNDSTPMASTPKSLTCPLCGLTITTDAVSRNAVA